MRQLKLQRGDTIIEVMVAFAVFAMVAIGALTVMNQGTASAQDTLETTQVRQQIDNQAEILRFLHQAYLANPNDTTPGGLPDKFRAIVTQARAVEAANIDEPTEFGQTCTQTIPGSNPAYRFVLNPANGSPLATGDVRAANHASAPPYAQVTGGVSYGMWVEPILSNAAGTGEARYIDFHIRACWNSASPSPQRTLGTIVRLYVPENVDTGTSGGDDVSLPLPIAHNFTMRGSDRTACHAHADVERLDSEGDPGWNPSNSAFWLPPGNPSWQCQTAGNEVYACVNYDSWFKPTGFTSPANDGTYRMTIEYDDARICAEGDILPPYNFKVAIYVNGEKRGDYNLVAPSGSYTISNIGTITDTSVIQVRWWNNHWYNVTQDPDFLIKQIRIERVG